MSERERWIVYPLLFLALGAALKDKFHPSPSIRAGKIECEQIECRQLKSAQISTLGVRVVDIRNRPKIMMQAVGQPAAKNPKEAEFSGRIDVFGTTGAPVASIGNEVNCELLRTQVGRVTRLAAGIIGTEHLAAADSLRTTKLVITDQNNRIRGFLRAQPRIARKDGQADPKDKQPADAKAEPTYCLMDFIGPERQTLLRLGGGPDGGFVVTSHAERRALLLTGHHGGHSGIFFVDGESQLTPIVDIPSELIEKQPRIPVPADEASRDEDSGEGAGETDDDQNATGGDAPKGEQVKDDSEAPK